MNSLIRISFALLFLCLAAVSGFAGNGSVKPFNYPKDFRNSKDLIHTVDSFLSISLVVSNTTAGNQTETASKPSEAVSSEGRICSCQILNLASANYNHRHVALLAEKTNHGASSDFRAAKNRIEKEKKELKRMFYDEVKVVSTVAAVGSCHALYVHLKNGDRNLQIYEILNADIR